MHLRVIALPDGSANYSILYGPIVLAARLGKQNQDGMFADDSRGGHIAAGPRPPLQTMPVIVGDKNNLLSDCPLIAFYFPPTAHPMLWLYPIAVLAATNRP